MLEASSDSSMTISWSPPSNNGGSAITGYRLYMNALNVGNWVLVYDGMG